MDSREQTLHWQDVLNDLIHLSASNSSGSFIGRNLLKKIPSLKKGLELDMD